MEPELFAPGVVSTGFYERDVLVTPDGSEIYYGFVAGRTVTIMRTRVENGTWTEPEVAPFARDLGYFHFEPALSPDGTRMYFLSNRPPAGAEPKTGWNYQNIWMSDRTEDGGWTEPRPIDPPVDSDRHEFFPSLTREGRLYFTRSEPGAGTGRLFRADPVDQGFAEPELVPIATTGGQNIFNVFVDPDERFVIACVEGREDATTPGMSDYYVYFRSEDDTWSDGVNMGGRLNRPGSNAISASMSPDGAYLFFALAVDDFEVGSPDKTMTVGDFRKKQTEPRNGLSDIYWVSGAVVEELRGKLDTPD
jgi:hypothetical protein